MKHVGWGGKGQPWLIEAQIKMVIKKATICHVPSIQTVSAPSCYNTMRVLSFKRHETGPQWLTCAALHDIKVQLQHWDDLTRQKTPQKTPKGRLKQQGFALASQGFRTVSNLPAACLTKENPAMIPKFESVQTVAVKRLNIFIRLISGLISINRD